MVDYFKNWYRNPLKYLIYLILLGLEVLVGVTLHFTVFTGVAMVFIIGVMYREFLNDKLRKWETDFKEELLRRVEFSSPLTSVHCRGETSRKFVICPIGKVISYNPEDYDNKYCPFCKKFYDSTLEAENQGFFKNTESQQIN